MQPGSRWVILAGASLPNDRGASVRDPFTLAALLR
jgi:hypothetical protein